MSKKEYNALEVVQILAKSLSNKLDAIKNPKEYTPLEVTQELAKMIKEKLDALQLVPEIKEELAKTEVFNPDISAHLDALEHHAFHAAARFHEDNDTTAARHLFLAKAHATVANVNPQDIIDIAYSAVEGEDLITSVFGKEMVLHPADSELSKALKQINELKTTVKRDVCETTYIPSGEGVDSIHNGPTPEDRKPKALREEDREMSKEEKEAEDKKKKDLEKLQEKDIDLDGKGSKENG